MKVAHIPVLLKHKKAQTKRFSKQTLESVFLIIGAIFVSLSALGFAKLSEYALGLNAQLFARFPYLAWLILPFGMAFVCALTRRFAPYTVGSGIPQVIACLHLPHSERKSRLVRLRETILKIPLTFLVMLCGGSVGREGPSVQVGAAIMLAWGRLCRKKNLAFKGLEDNLLLGIGAAGGLAAAFNAPLAGVIFAIEEIGRGRAIRWDRGVLLGVASCGMVLLMIEGNHPYFSKLAHITDFPYQIFWVIACALVCGVAGGLFSRVLCKGLLSFLPRSLRGFASKHPVYMAFFCGLVLAGLGTFYSGETYGTGYAAVAKGLTGDPELSHVSLGLGKWLATVFSYWAQVPGGIFTPCLAIGGILGKTLALFGNAPVDVLVVLGMAAFLAAATQAPLTACVVVMEMTSTQNYIFYLLLVCIIASSVSRQFSPKAFYHFAATRFLERLKTEEKT